MTMCIYKNVYSKNTECSSKYTMAASIMSRESTDFMTHKAIETRESLARNYVPIINPVNQKPMLHLRKDGDCTIVDPRACIHHYNSSADLSCIIYAHVSLPYFHAMVRAGYINNRLRIVLRCTESDTYAHAIVENIPDKNNTRTPTVSEMLGELRNTSDNFGNCRTGVALVTIEPGYRFIQTQSMFRRKNRYSRAPPPVTTAVVNAKTWWHRLTVAKGLYDCQRTLFGEEAARGLNSCSRTAKKPEDGRVTVPILVIEAPWGFKRSAEVGDKRHTSSADRER